MVAHGGDRETLVVGKTNPQRVEQVRSDKALDIDGLSKIQILVPVQAVAIGCHHHNCRSRTEGKDELFKLTLRSLSQFYVEKRY